jgi:hypothetical protein
VWNNRRKSSSSGGRNFLLQKTFLLPESPVRRIAI